jgi:hypothetical protein
MRFDSFANAIFVTPLPCHFQKFFPWWQRVAEVIELFGEDEYVFVAGDVFKVDQRTLTTPVVVDSSKGQLKEIF